MPYDRRGKLLKKAVALLLLNFSRFKSINDIFGNGIGNELLRRVVHRLPEIACPLPHGYPFFQMIYGILQKNKTRGN
ncbi:diguanylate cyclase domain-containing protein [Desulfogranum marinum]|uniref:diguanylate cyclase domain-containing protein n=1 Tax=Desulfogranum marinum TaxID=453220 RepID=UPI00374CC048